MRQHQVGAVVPQNPGQAGHGGRVKPAGRPQPARQGQGPVDPDSALPVEQADQCVPAIGASELVDQSPGEDLGSPAEGRRDDVKDLVFRGLADAREPSDGVWPMMKRILLGFGAESPATCNSI